MVGQSLDVAVLVRIEAPSTAEVTALMWSGEPFVCAEAQPSDKRHAQAECERSTSEALRSIGLWGSGGEKQASGSNTRQTHHFISLPVISGGSVEIVCRWKGSRQ